MNFAYNVGCCFDAARRDGNMSGEYINKLWHDRFAPDRRYKIYFLAGNGSTEMVRVGREKILIRFIDGITYARAYTDSDLYDKKPCFQCGELFDDRIIYIGKWQYNVLI